MYVLYLCYFFAFTAALVVDPRIVRGSVVPVVLRNDGWTKSVTTANDPQPMCGETLSDAVIVERRNSPRRLRANE